MSGGGSSACTPPPLPSPLVPLDHPCPDHQACRRLAFARLRRRAPRRESPTVSADFALGPAPVSMEAASMQADIHPMDAPDFSPGQPQRLPTRRGFPCRARVPSLRARAWHTPDPPVAVAGSRYLPPNRPGASLPARRLVPSPDAWCGGNIYPDEVEAVRVYPPVQWEDERPRRGRPPKWLSEQRRAAAQT